MMDDAHERERQSNLRPPAWVNPTPADRYHLVIIGGGPAGLAAASTAVALGARVALIERSLLGGNSVNVGCVPSKAIIRSSRAFAEMRDAARYGAHASTDIRVEFAAVMDRMRRLRARISRSDAASRLAAVGVDVFFGDARFTGPDTVTVGGATLRFKKAMIATGSRPEIPSIPGLAEAGYLTNESIFDLTALPTRLLVIGGGPLGCEMAQAFCRLGAKTVIVQDAPMFLPKEERDAAQILSDTFARDGLEVRLNTSVVQLRVDGKQILVDLIHDDYSSTVTVDAILTGVGRLPNVGGMQLEAAGVEYDATTGIHVDDFLRTTNRQVYAAGDVCLEQRYAHTADATGRMAVHNAMFLGRQRLSDLTVPWCTFTDPEIAHVGISARARGSRPGYPGQDLHGPAARGESCDRRQRGCRLRQDPRSRRLRSHFGCDDRRSSCRRDDQRADAGDGRGSRHADVVSGHPRVAGAGWSDQGRGGHVLPYAGDPEDQGTASTLVGALSQVAPERLTIARDEMIRRQMMQVGLLGVGGHVEKKL